MKLFSRQRAQVVPGRIEQGRLRPCRLASNGRVATVGESHYQAALKAAAGSRSALAMEDAIQVTAVLVPEPGNPHDHQAVRIDVDGRTVSYLDRGLAADYQPVLLRLAAEGRQGWCPGRIMGGGTRYYGIHLHLSEPDRVVPCHEPEGLELLDPGRTASVTGSREHQEQRGRAAAALKVVEHASAWFELALGTASTGKCSGELRLDVFLAGECLGQLSKLNTDRHASTVRGLLDAGHRPACLGYLELVETRWLAQVSLPHTAD